MKKSKNQLIIFAIIVLISFLLPINTGSVQAAKAAPEVSVKEKTLYVKGKSYTIKIKNLAKNAKVTYKSSDEVIATVSDKGVVKPLAKGTVTINVTIKQDKYYGFDIKINVKEKSSKKVTPVAQWKDSKKKYT